MKIKPILRNPYVLAARMRNGGGPMKDRRTPRGGSHNKLKQYLEEYEDIIETDSLEERKATMAKKEARKVDNTIKIAYAIFPTPFGKGYGCFAITKKAEGEYCVSPSYCHPNDRVKFSKSKARLTAIARMDSPAYAGNVKIVVQLDKDGKPQDITMEEIVTEYLNNYCAPSWADHSFNIGLWRFTLKLDNYNFFDYVDLLMNEAGADTTVVAMDLINWAKNGDSNICW